MLRRLILLLALVPSPAGAGADPADTGGPEVHGVRVRLSRDHNVIRSGPGDGFAIAAVHRKGATFPVVAKRGEWYNVRLSATETGWVHEGLCEEHEDLSHLELRPNPRLYSRIGSFVLTGTTGAYAFDRKANSLLAGGRVGYYVLDFLGVEGSVTWTHVDRPREIVESLFGLSLEGEAFHMLFYSMNVVAEILPGRRMVPFVTAGVGSTILQGDVEPTWNVGGGTALFVSKRVAMRWEFRNHRFRSGTAGARRQNSNIEFSFGSSFLF